MGCQKLIISNKRELRLKNGLTQEQFTEELGIIVNGVYNIEINRYQPTANMIDKICSAVIITTAKLLIMNSELNEDLIKNTNTLIYNCSKK